MPNLLEKITSQPEFRLARSLAFLVELSWDTLPVGFENFLFEAKMFGLVPIIAHVARFHYVQKAPHRVGYWRKLGAKIQIDSGSILGAFGRKAKKTAKLLFEKQWVDIIASDAHDTNLRSYNLTEALEYIGKRYGVSTVGLLLKNARSILELYSY